MYMYMYMYMHMYVHVHTCTHTAAGVQENYLKERQVDAVSNCGYSGTILALSTGHGIVALVLD